jgi:hypothetical protein
VDVCPWGDPVLWALARKACSLDLAEGYAATSALGKSQPPNATTAIFLG